MNTELVKLGEEFFARKQAVINGMITARNGYLEAGKNLLVIKQKKLYLIDGNHVISFAHWVENELCISKATAYQMIAVYEKFGDLLSHPDYQDIDYSKAAMLLSYVPDNAPLEKKEELLSMAKGQTVKGLADNLASFRGKTPTDACDHPADKQEVWNKCTVCKKLWR